MKGDADSPHRRTGARSAEPTWLTLGQAAKYLGIAQSTVRVWTDSGRLPVFYTPGGHRRFLRSDLDAFIQRNGAGSRPRGDAVVLVVDDNPKLRSFIRVNLEFDGMVVREAATAEEGLAALDEDPPDLVMLDVNLPGIDGWEMLRRVRERHGIETLPVIMFSGESEDDHAEEIGANTFVGKPLDPLALVEQAKALLRVRVTQFG
ncbi:MAG TPA: response regulator [Gaiellales bacterium]|jgi:excisionase family DNA binding protein